MAVESLGIFDRLITEALHIADTVRSISNDLFYEILTLISTQPYMKPRMSNKLAKSGAFRYESGYGIAFEVIWEYYNFRSQEEYMESTADTNCRFYPEGNVIFVGVAAVNNKIDEKILAEDIQHEISHMFEYYNKGRIGLPYENPKIYDKAIEDLITSDNETLKNDIATIIHMKSKAEQGAFANGAYHYLMKSDDYIHKFENAKKKTLLYRYAKDVRGAYERLSKYKGDEPYLIKAMRPYKTTHQRLLKDAKEVERRLAWLMGRIVSKAINDYKSMHGARIMIRPENRRRVSEAINKARNEALEKYYKGTPLWYGFCKGER